MSIAKCCMVIAVMAAIIMAEESSELKINGWGWYTFGRVGSGYTQFNPVQLGIDNADIDFTDFWLTDFNAGIKLEKAMNNQIKFRLHTGFSTVFQMQDQRVVSKDFLVRKFAPYLIDAAVERTFVINDANKLLVEFGYLPVRYNPQAANLGEYLFGRTTPYPAVVQSGFELADKEKAPGLHLAYTFNFLKKSFFRADEYLYTEMKQWPIGDISEALLLTVNTEQFFELGFGVNFHHLISVDERQTTPGLDKTRLAGQPASYIYVKDGDTTWYTGRGIKLMGRFTLNPRTFISWSGLGSEDLKLFAEAAILGIKNYPGWYEKWIERCPVMFGFNFPAFKLLDVLSLQVQWFGNKYFNAWENMNKEGNFTPYIGRRTTMMDYEAYKEALADSTLSEVTWDDWKWSVYMSRKINNRIRLSLQFANDNMFKNPYNPPPPAPIKYTEICGRTWWVEVNKETGEKKEKFGMIWDWYWMGRVMFYF